MRCLSTIAIFLFFLNYVLKTNAGNNFTFARKISHDPIIDGDTSDYVWQGLQWKNIPYLYVDAASGNQNTLPEQNDLSARYKIAWTSNYIYILAEITDDVLLFNVSPDKPDKVFSGDSFEIFLDEDTSGGAHTKTHNAFAYHISPTGVTADQCGCGDSTDYSGSSGDWNGRFFNDHIKSSYRSIGNKYYWEIQVKVYNKHYNESESQHINETRRVNLVKNKILGFGVAYNDYDNDISKREHMIGSFSISGNNNGDYFTTGGRNVGWQNASVFGRIELVEDTCISPLISLASPFIYDRNKPVDNSYNISISNKYPDMPQSIHISQNNANKFAYVTLNTTTGLLVINSIVGHGFIPITLTSANFCGNIFYHQSVLTICGKPFFTLQNSELTLRTDSSLEDTIKFKFTEENIVYQISNPHEDKLIVNTTNNILKIKQINTIENDFNITVTASNFCESYSKTLKLKVDKVNGIGKNDPLKNDKYNVYPNPANDYFTVGDIDDATMFSLFTFDGKAVFENKHDNIFFTKELRNGFYFLKATNSHSSTTQKILIIHK